MQTPVALSKIFMYAEFIFSNNFETAVLRLNMLSMQIKVKPIAAAIDKGSVYSGRKERIIKIILLLIIANTHAVITVISQIPILRCRKTRLFRQSASS